MMGMFTRRAALLAAGTLAGGTVAAATQWRKPPPEIHTLVTPTQAALGTMGGLVPTDPPKPLPDAAFLDADGNRRTVGEFAGKGLVINLWATWCVPCVAELPALQAAARALRTDGIVVLALSSDRGGASVVRKFYAAHDIDALDIWLDPKGEAARAWGARGLPTTFIVDRTGKNRAKLEGAADWASAEAVTAVRALMR